MILAQDVTLGNMLTTERKPKKGSSATLNYSRGDSEALFATGLLGESGGGFRGDTGTSVERGAWKDPQPHGCQRPESLSGTETSCQKYGSQIPAPYPPGRTALVEGKGEGKRPSPGKPSMRSLFLMRFNQSRPSWSHHRSTMNQILQWSPGRCKVNITTQERRPCGPVIHSVQFEPPWSFCTFLVWLLEGSTRSSTGAPITGGDRRPGMVPGFQEAGPKDATSIAVSPDHHYRTRR